ALLQIDLVDPVIGTLEIRHPGRKVALAALLESARRELAAVVPLPAPHAGGHCRQAPGDGKRLPRREREVFLGRQLVCAETGRAQEADTSCGPAVVADQVGVSVASAVAHQVPDHARAPRVGEGTDASGPRRLAGSKVLTLSCTKKYQRQRRLVLG